MKGLEKLAGAHHRNPMIDLCLDMFKNVSQDVHTKRGQIIVNLFGGEVKNGTIDCYKNVSPVLQVFSSLPST